MINWQKTITEPPILKHLTNEEIQQLVQYGGEGELLSKRLPCHTQAVERAVKLTTEAATSLSEDSSRLGAIKAKLESQAVNSGSGGIYFLDAPGGTGKTFLISLLLVRIRSRNDVALAMASSGIAATLLEGGRTAHSALKLPLNMQITETPICNIAKNSAMAKILQVCKLIVWDECTMAHKRSLEALDRTLKDLRDNQNIFGGAMILLLGDFRQTLPVIPRSTVADELNACLKSSNLWQYVKTLHLTTNMRVFLQQDETANVFAKQLLDIGNNKVAVDTSTGFIILPTDFCHITDSKVELIQRVFPDIAQKFNNHNWLGERAILAAKNKDVEDLFSLCKKSTEFPGPSKQSTHETPLTNDPMWKDALVTEGEHGVLPIAAIATTSADALGYVELIEQEYDAIASCDKAFGKNVPLSAFANYHHILWWYKIALLDAKHGKASHDQLNLIQFVEGYDTVVGAGAATYIEGLGDFTAMNGVKYYVTAREPNGQGHYGAITELTHNLYETHIAPAVSFGTVLADITATRERRSQLSH
ncbi:unnamed protein product [Colias eurytheme]|nr:unnamed protein product [Colias eurytheme]